MSDPTGDTDFFISYRGTASAWAHWVNWVVRSAGYTTRLMAEFPIGTTWTDQMRQAAAHCRRLIPLYSADYWSSGACVEEFDAYWRQHLQNRPARFLLPVTVEECTVPDMHGMLLSSRIYNLGRDAALEAVRNVLRDIPPCHPGPPYAEVEPPFPGAQASRLATDWPETPPADFRWPLADHSEARLAFSQLVTRAAPHRLLSIRGDSQTGKSHLTRQFFTNAQRRLPDCAAGRLEFKGTIDLESALADFAHHLQVALPAAASGLRPRLGAILASLERRAGPALLIFDGYEFAGEADTWIREQLLTSLYRFKWLRVILAGQRVPERHGQHWEEDARSVTLTPPSADDWFAWSQENNRGLTLAFVKQLHKATGGRASVIAPVLGPVA